jgi:hypothetical protein
MNWLRREEWREGFENLLRLHVVTACDRVDIEIDDLVAVIGADLETSPASKAVQAGGSCSLAASCCCETGKRLVASANRRVAEAKTPGH